MLTGDKYESGISTGIEKKAVEAVKPKGYVELHCITNGSTYSDDEEILNVAIFKKKKAEHEHVADPDDF